mmetsp:Transcript_16055/g.45910  ORF Transcript_16055/g.45910 Transcript_16055/m.45910 type:complete len:97 (-) Transcript_16055:1307-1597(-)
MSAMVYKYRWLELDMPCDGSHLGDLEGLLQEAWPGSRPRGSARSARAIWEDQLLSLIGIARSLVVADSIEADVDLASCAVVCPLVACRSWTCRRME